MWTHIESGNDEQSISPFQRAQGELILGGEAFYEHVRNSVLERESATADLDLPQPRLLRRPTGLPGPDSMQARVHRHSRISRNSGQEASSYPPFASAPA